ncbi:hypothetical protein K443DRAFT_676182 [Laccaria amethystina LaAM-08-1]|uniref:Caleosin-domain-containing protein n=1 Tax=Laccaria amethystina LaAM-08-1 TaxID=1095629 RepID=A0A0C9Y849_9AGAR|nr:hypothetical protein K443DRAFT_676182 [Laccaria amethystina LaAM-08-1]
MVVPVDATYPAPGKGFDPHKKNTALQSHVAFFDRDGDGVIWPLDTFLGFRALKFSIFFCILATIFVHGGLSYVLWDGFVPDPFFRLNIKWAHRGKHGSDSGAYTTVGEFDNDRFNKIFDMYSSPPHKEMTFMEGVRMLHGNMNPYDFFGWVASAFEWLATYLLIAPPDGNMRRDDVKAVYNGSIFYHISGREVPRQ